MYAIIRTGGKQYRVAPGDILDVELLPGTPAPAAGNPASKPSQSAAFSEVLLIGGDSGTQLGSPVIDGASVTFEFVDSIKAPKVIAYKFKRRKGYHRTVGHRQKLSRIKVLKIEGGKK